MKKFCWLKKNCNAPLKEKNLMSDLENELPVEDLEAVVEDGIVEEALVDVESSELAEFDSVEIEDVEILAPEQVDSILESLLFATDKPISLATLKASFKGTQVKTDDLRAAIERIAMIYQGGTHGFELLEIGSGYQFRTKTENIKFLTRAVKPRSFRLSGPALEVLSIVAYKQPVVKSEIDDIRGVESGHVLRALMEKALIGFEGKSDLPGKPMQYGTSKRFLEIFGMRNLKELPTLSQIDELLPDGIGDENDVEKENLSELTGNEITDKLTAITTTSEFFENEKLKQKETKEQQKANDLRTQLEIGVKLTNRDLKWLERYDLKLMAPAEPTLDSEPVLEENNEARFAEEEDISLDQDLNVAEHDDEGEEGPAH
jgi:segregation and condensation protein B